MLEVRSIRPQDGEQLWKTVDSLEQSYWTGLDCRIYAGDVYLDEVISLQYELQEMVQPLFSYASYTHDTVLHGARRIQGTFTLNFKREGYLFELLRHLDQGTVPAVPAEARNPAAYRVASAGDATMEDLLSLVTKGKGSGGKRRLGPEELANLRKVKKEFEDAVWNPGATSASPLTPYTALTRSRFGLNRSWDLTLKFGSADRENPSAPTIADTTGKKPDSVPQEVTTVTRLVGVELLGVGRIIDDSGRPTIEQYAFLARDLI